MVKNGGSVSVRELYGLVDSRMAEVNQSIIRVEKKFDDLASGRLAALEQKQANLEGRLLIVPILVAAAISVFGIVINLVLRIK